MADDEASFSCGPLRRDSDGAWYLGAYQVGVDERLFVEDFVLAAREYAALTGIPDVQRPPPPAVQMSLSWPTDDPPPANIDDSMTVLAENRRIMQEIYKGTYCPACQRDARCYRRNFHREMAQTLVKFAAADEAQPRNRRGYVSLRAVLGLKTAPKVSSDVAYLTHWDLVRRKPDSAGLYIITDRGRAFVKGHGVVPKYAWIYNGRLHKFEEPMITIDQALAEPLDVKGMLGTRQESLGGPF